MGTVMIKTDPIMDQPFNLTTLKRIISQLYPFYAEGRHHRPASLFSFNPSGLSKPPAIAVQASVKNQIIANLIRHMQGCVMRHYVTLEQRQTQAAIIVKKLLHFHIHVSTLSCIKLCSRL
jgi:hypothetical protein